MQIERETLEAEAKRGVVALQSGDFATARDAFANVTTSSFASPQAWLFYAQACELSLEGIVSKRAEAAYSPGNRGLWVKVKCQNREEFVVVGWTDPEGARPWLGACCSRITIPTGGSSTQGASAPESTMRS